MSERPDDCVCFDRWTEEDLPCFACYCAGFEIPNPNPDDPADKQRDAHQQAMEDYHDKLRAENEYPDMEAHHA